MNTDLERVIALQKLVSAAHAAERRLARSPSAKKVLEARTSKAARQQVAAPKSTWPKTKTPDAPSRKRVAVHQTRLSKFREQAMAVKTNQEYHAVQKGNRVRPGRKSKPSKTASSSGWSKPTTSPRASSGWRATSRASKKAVDAERPRRSRRAHGVEGVARRNCHRTRRGRGRPQPHGARNVRARRPATQRCVAVAEARDGICHGLPCKAASADLQYRPQERADHAVRQLSAHSVLRPRLPGHRACPRRDRLQPS